MCVCVCGDVQYVYGMYEGNVCACVSECDHKLLEDLRHWSEVQELQQAEHEKDDCVPGLAISTSGSLSKAQGGKLTKQPTSLSTNASLTPGQ